MEGSGGTSNRAEAERWLNIAEKLLAARDFHGAKSFAIRARDSYPRLDATEQIIAVADTLLAGDCRILNSQLDWYGILQLVRLTQNLELVAAQYRRLALLLNPERNRLACADQAFKLVSDAWTVLSNPSKKAEYDNSLGFHSDTGSTQHPQPQPQPQPPPPPPPPPQQQQLPVRRSPRTKDGKLVAEEERPSFNNVTESTPSTESDAPSFWTACPYCYVLYEYPKIYEECTLRCQNCKRAFHAVMIPSPPVTDKDTYFCCWGFFPLGVSGNAKQTSGSSKWTPISPMFACPVPPVSERNRNQLPKPKKVSKPRVYYDDQDPLVEFSEPSEDSDDEWEGDRKKRKTKKKAPAVKNAKRVQMERVKKGGSGEVLDGVNVGESSAPKAAGVSSTKKRGATELDLNVEFSNEVEEPAPGISEGNGTGNGEEDNIEGIGFFEGLDEFLSSLPILKG